MNLWRPYLLSSPTLFLRQGISLHLGLPISSRLGDYQAPSILLSVPLPSILGLQAFITAPSFDMHVLGIHTWLFTLEHKRGS